jgi:LysR family transcriptional activator of nhaA
LGQQIPDAIRGKSSLHELKLVVGVADVLPKLITYRILEPALHLSESVRFDFPQSLDDAPMLLPTSNTTFRQVMEQWFHAEAIRPAAIAESEDSSLLKVLGQAGLGLFPVPTAIEKEVQRQYRVRAVGRLESATTQFYAISTERKLRHPAVKAISAAVKDSLFGGTG